MKRMLVGSALLLLNIMVNASLSLSEPTILPVPNSITDYGYFLSDISANGDKVLISNVEDIKSGTNGVKYSLQSYDFSSLTYSMEKSALGMNGSAEFGSAIFMGNAGLNNKHQLVYSDYVLKVDEFQPVVQLGNLDTVTLVGSGELVSEKFDSILIRESSSKLSQWSAEEGYKSFNTIFSEDSLYANADFGEGMFYIENSDVYKFDYLSEEITLVESNVGDRSLGLLISAIGGGSVVYSQNENESGILNIILEDTTTGVKAVIDEVEVEHLASGVPIRGNFSDDNRYLMIQYFIEENGSSRSNIVIFDLITNEKLINYGHDKKIALRAILSGNGKKLAITRVDDDFDWENNLGAEVVVYDVISSVDSSVMVSVNTTSDIIDPYNNQLSEFSIDLSGTSIYGLDVSCNLSSTSLSVTHTNYDGLFGSQNTITLPLIYDATSVTGTETLIAPESSFAGAGSFVLADVIAEFTTEDVHVTCAAEVSDENGQLLQVTLTPATIRIDDGVHGGSGSVSGAIVIPGVTDLSGVEVVLTIDGRQVTVTTDETGRFEFDGLRDGEFTISLASDNYVQSCQAANVTEGGANDLGSIELLAGDINADGNIDIADFTFMAARYRSNQGDADYDAKADLNRDGTINIQDLAILGSHFGSTQCNL